MTSHISLDNMSPVSVDINSPDHVVSSVGIAGPKDDPAVGCAGCVDDLSNPVKIGGIVHQGSEDPQIGGSKHPPNGGVKNRSKNTPKRDI